MRFTLPILLGVSLFAMPALAQPTQSNATTQNGGADSTMQPTSPGSGSSMMGAGGASMAQAHGAPDPGNCGTPDERKPCAGVRMRGKPAAAHP